MNSLVSGLHCDNNAVTSELKVSALSICSSPQLRNCSLRWRPQNNWSTSVHRAVVSWRHCMEWITALPDPHICL